MRRPRPLPENLIGRPFDRSAAADEHLPLGRLRRQDLVRPFHGVRSTAAPASVLERCHAYRARMRPADVFSHVTAALLHGMPLPARLERRVAIDVAAVHPAAAPATRGVIGHRLRKPPAVSELDGLPVCDAVETWCQLAGLIGLEDLVIAADFLLGDGRAAGLATNEELAAAVETPGRYRTAALRAALRLAQVGSRSPQESRLRVVLMLGGLPPAELNGPVTDDGGRVLGHGDLVWRTRRALSEYEGDHHRTDAEQYAYDIRRYDAFQLAGWRLMRVTKQELEMPNRPALIVRARRTLGL